MALATGVTTLVLGGSAGGAFPGANGKIVYQSQVGGGVDYEIVAVDPTGGGPDQLTSNDAFDANPSFSADGERIVFEGAGSDIWVMNADGSNQTQLTDDAVFDATPAFSPDGHKVVLARYDGTDFEISVMDADGQNIVQLTNNGVPDQDPSFSPNGERIVFTRFEPSDNEIVAMDADGQNETPLTSNSFDDSDPSWAPDGQQIVFARQDVDDEIWMMDAGGQNQTPLTNDSLFNDAPAFSPDATKIAFVQDAGAANDIFVMDASGQNPVPVTSDPAFDVDPDWQPLNPPAIEITAGKQRSARAVSATVVSLNENATATLDGTLKAPRAPKAAPSKKKTVQLDAVTLQLQPGQPVEVPIPVAGKGRKLLKRALKAGKKPKGTITASATDDLGASSQDAQHVRYKKRKR